MTDLPPLLLGLMIPPPPSLFLTHQNQLQLHHIAPIPPQQQQQQQQQQLSAATEGGEENQRERIQLPFLFRILMPMEIMDQSDIIGITDATKNTRTRFSSSSTQSYKLLTAVPLTASTQRVSPSNVPTHTQGSTTLRRQNSWQGGGLSNPNHIKQPADRLSSHMGIISVDRGKSNTRRFCNQFCSTQQHVWLRAVTGVVPVALKERVLQLLEAA